MKKYLDVKDHLVTTGCQTTSLFISYIDSGFEPTINAKINRFSSTLPAIFIENKVEIIQQENKNK